MGSESTNEKPKQMNKFGEMGSESANDKYEIINKLGEGSFGTVYLVKDKENQYFALKKLMINAQTESTIKQFPNLMEKLLHIGYKSRYRYIIKYYKYFEQQNEINIIMEYVRGKNLKQFIEDFKNKGQLIEEKIIKKIIEQICFGLRDIHDENIIHRDLTPDNIFIDENNNIKIGDFGVSKILNTKNKYAKTHTGKLHYNAPEIEKSQKYSNKIDIYSLGCIIYELFFLNEYYIDKFIDEEIKQINQDVYNSKWQDIIDSLLKKDPYQRPNIYEIIEKIKIINPPEIIKIFLDYEYDEDDCEIEVDVNKTILELKKIILKVFDIKNVCAEELILVYGQYLLHDKKLIKEYGIKNNRSVKAYEPKLLAG